MTTPGSYRGAGGSSILLAWNTVHPVWIRPSIISTPARFAKSEENPDVIQPSRAVLPARRACALHVARNPRIPPRQAPPRLRQQRQQPAQGHGVGGQRAGG